MPRMTKDFDPYHKWLGIPPQEQPPNHYRLLALGLFESDPEVIDAAANRQMAYLQQRATGERAAISQKLLNELSAARLCLLNREKKAAYDAELKSKSAGALSNTGRTEPTTPDPFAVLQPTTSTEVRSKSGEPAVPKQMPSETAVPVADSAPRATGSRLSGKIIIGSGVAVLFLILWFAFSGGKKKEAMVAQVPSSGDQSASEQGQKDHAAASEKKRPAETHDASPLLPEPKPGTSIISVVQPLKQSQPQIPTTPKPPELVEVSELNPGTYPWLSPDGLTVFWERKHDTIWTAHRENPEANFVGQKELFAGRQPTVTADGLRMVHVARSSGGPNEESLYTTERTSIDEPFRRSTEISELVDQPKAMQPCLSGDGLTLYFTVGSVADYHLMVTSRQSLSAPWSTPLPVSTINQTGEPLNWPFVLDDHLAMFCFGGHGWQTNLSYWRRPSVQQPFVKLSNLSVEGVPLVGRSPRYVAATNELFFTRFLGPKQFAIWVVKNFVPPAGIPLAASEQAKAGPENKPLDVSALRSAGLLFVLTFDENQFHDPSDRFEILDSHGNTRTIENHGAMIVEGRVGKGVRFDKTNYVEISGEYPTGQSPRTLALWMKMRHESNVEHPIVYGKNGRGQPFGIMAAHGHWCVYGNGSVGIGTDIFTDISVDLLWHHHCVTYDGSRVVYYFDGQPAFTSSTSLTTAAGPLFLGQCFGRSGKRSFDGDIDELAVFDRALDATDVSRLHQMGIDGTSLDTLLHK